MNNDKTTLLIQEPPNNFEIKKIVIRIFNKRNSKCRIQPIYIKGILYPKKENM